MHGAGYELFAGAGFAIDADARFALRDALDQRHNAAHGFAGPDHVVLADATLQVLVFTLKPRELVGILDSDQQLFGGERLLEKIQSAETRGSYRHLDVRLTAHHHDGRSYAGALE